MTTAAFRILPMVLLLACAGLAGPAAGSAAGPGEDLSAHASEPYVYERLARSYRFEADGTGRVVFEVRVKVLSEVGVQQLGQLLFPYVAGRNRLELELLRLHKPDGTVTAGSPDLVQDLPAPVTALFPVYSDARVLHVTVPAFRPGDVLEYRLAHHLERPEAPNRFWMADAFEKNATVLEETIEADVPAGERINLYLADGVEQEVVERDGRRIYRWTRADAAPPEPAPRKPALPKTPEDLTNMMADLFNQTLGAWPGFDVELSSFRDWRDVGAWYAALQGDRAAPDRAIRRQADKLIAGRDGDLAKIEAIYNYVATEFRYLALLFGAGRYQPHAASVVLKNGYGDCKDKHTLLAALLEAAGFRSSAVLIGSFGEPTEDVPSPQSFDHVITAVSLGDEVLWLDSSQLAPFQYLPPTLRGKTALRVPASGEAGLVEVPAALPYAAMRSFTFAGEVDETGRLAGRVRLRLRGDAEYGLRAALFVTGKDAWPLVVQTTSLMLGFWGLHGEITDLEVGDLAAIEEPLSLSFSLTRPEYLDPFSKEQKVGVLRPIARFRPPPEPSGEPPEPMELGEVLRESSRFELTLPPSFEARAPVAVAIERDFGSYVSRYSVDGRRLVAETETEIKRQRLPPERFREWDALRKTATADGRQSFTVRLTADGRQAVARLSDPSSLMRAASGAARDDEWETAAALLARVVELEPENAEAWFRLGKALVKTGEAQKGAEALGRQIEIDPFDERAYVTLGWALKESGDAAGAEAAFRTQLERYPLDPAANARLGELLDEQERCGEAVPFLENALSIRSDHHKSRMRLGRCYLRLGRREEGLATLEPLAESSDVWSLHQAGYAANEHEAWDTAVLLLRRVTELDPDHEYAFNNLGWALLEQGHLDEAVAALRRQIEIEPRDKWAHRNLARALLEQEKYPESVAAARKHLEIVPDDTYALAQLAAALWSTGELAEAVDAYRKIIALDPAYPNVNSMLGVGLFHLNRFDEAAEALVKALAVDADDLAANRTLGVIYARQERDAEALPLLEKALEIAPEQFRDQDILDYVRKKVTSRGP